MTGHIIFETYDRRGGSFWKKLIDRFTCHMWTNVLDIQIGHKPKYMVRLRIDRCVDCGIRQLWLIREDRIPGLP